MPASKSCCANAPALLPSVGGLATWMTILLRVRVPVLSEQSMSIPAIASIDASRVTIAPSLRIPRRLVRRRAARGVGEASLGEHAGAHGEGGGGDDLEGEGDGGHEHHHGEGERVLPREQGQGYCC